MEGVSRGWRRVGHKGSESGVGGDRAMEGVSQGVKASGRERVRGRRERAREGVSQGAEANKRERDTDRLDTVYRDCNRFEIF